MSSRGLSLQAIPLCVMLAMIAPAFLTLPVATAAAQTVSAADMVPVTLATGENAARLVFDFPRLTAYSVVDSSAQHITLRFRTDIPLGFESRTSPLIEKIETQNVSEGALVRVTVKAGQKIKHYRLQKKVVIDIGSGTTEAKRENKTEATAAPAPTPAPAKAATPVTEKPARETTAKPETAATQKLAKDIAKATEAVKQKPNEGPAVPAAPAAKVDPAVIIDKPAPAEDAAAANAAAANTGPTSISFAMLEPSKIATFTRFNQLWVVIDTKNGSAQPPKIEGGLADKISAPRVISMNNGTAYRFTLPRHLNYSVRKENMSWKVLISEEPLDNGAEKQPTLEFDSGKGKLVVPLEGGGSPITIEDPDVGDTLLVIPTNKTQSRIDRARHFANLDILPAAAGFAMKPLADDIRANQIENFVLVTAPNGILATARAAVGPVMAIDPDAAIEDTRRLFDFPNWRQGGLPRLQQNASYILQQAAVGEGEVREEYLMKLALLYFANNMGHEALGVMRIIEQDNAEYADNPNFIALRGAANAMAGKYEDALKDLGNASLQNHPEINLWVGYAAAATEQWQMANKSFPKNNTLLVQYPENIAVPITIYMAESALRLGHTQSAQQLLETIDGSESVKDPHYSAAVAYLRGEIARQEGRTDDAIKIWKDVAAGLDRLYHTKGSLALANIEFQQKKITAREAADMIDSLRFAWRGDGLEVQIMHSLGLMRAQAGNYYESLQDLKTAMALESGLGNDTDDIRADQLRIFASIFEGENTGKIKPMEAVSIYNEFSSLVPEGIDGAKIKLQVADFMASIDLLEKSAGMIETLLDDGAVPPELVGRTGEKLAAIYILDNRPSQAIDALNRTASANMTDIVRESRALLMARAQSQLNMIDEAAATLSNFTSVDAQRLKVDLLWRARKWADAATALSPLLPLPDAKEISDSEAELVINRAVACKLASDTRCLMDMKYSFGPLMAKTKQATAFSVVTRDGGLSTLADRETILNIAGEADLFKNFLDSYKSLDKADTSASAATPAPAPTATPAATPAATAAEPATNAAAP